MKIVAIHDGAGPIRGSEKVLLDLMQGLAKREHTWHLLTNHPEMHAAAIALGFAAELLPFNRLLVDKSGLRNWRQSWRCFKRLREVIREFNPQVIHINNGGACQWAVPASATLAGPSVVHLHAPWSRKMRFLLGLHHPDCIVGVSRAIVSPILADPLAAPNVCVIYNGIADSGIGNPASRFKMRHALGLTDEQFVIAFAGVLIPEKRAQDAIAAVRLLANEKCVLLIVGDGPYREQLTKLAFGLPVLFLGHRSDAQVLMRDACDAVILPSHIEAFSLVLLEAAICGLPRIASDAGGNVESIHHLHDGLIVPLGDIAGLAKAIQTLSADKTLVTSLGNHARARALQEFSVSGFLDNFEQLYSRLSKKKPERLLQKIVRYLRSNLFLILGSDAKAGAKHHV
jgi:glycosyltransferase involved in cell wall biosynthesis